MLNRQLPPPFVRSTSFNLLEPVTINTPNGLNIRFISGGEQEIVRVEFIFKAGRWYEPVNGVSHFTSSLLSKGTADKSSFTIAQLFDSYGSHVDVTPGLDAVTVSLYALVKNLQPVLNLICEVITKPVFPEKELKQSTSIFLQNLKVNNEKTSFLASKIIRKNIFGENHPYGKDLEENDVLALRQEQLVDFHNQFFGDAHVIVAGKISAETQALITETLSQFPTRKINTLRDFPVNTALSQAYIEKEGSLQTSIRLGKRSLQRTHADYVDILFLNHIVGGYFGSRLMKNIREEKGLTYGIYSSLNTLKNDSYVVIGADVNKENKDLAIQEIKNELKKLRHEEISAEELNTARYHFIGSLQTEMTTSFAHADKIKSLLLYNLPKEYYQNMINRIDVITAKELLTTANTYFNEDSYTEVSVG